jgi:hypothetical protein
VENHIFISDREKGITNSVEKCFPQALHLHCCQHIADNLQQRFGNKVRPLFWHVAYAKTQEAFAEKIELLQKENQSAYSYLLAIPKRLWTRAYQPYPKYGHNTSNIVESLNGALSDIRHQPPIRMMDSIHSYCMNLVFDRARVLQISQHLANVPWSKYLNRLEKSRQFNVFPSGNGICQVEVPDTGFKYVVDLANELCDCKDFYEYQGPCTHAIAASRHQGGDPLALFNNRYTTQYFRRTYSHPVIPVSINDLQTDPSILPPLIRKQPGRPHTKRYRKGQWSKKQKQCSNCLDWGHYRRTCRRQPVSSGRKERAHDWLNGTVDVASMEGSDKGSDESSGTEGGTEDMIVVELCDELSELASDLFNESYYLD